MVTDCKTRISVYTFSFSHNIRTPFCILQLSLSLSLSPLFSIIKGEKTFFRFKPFQNHLLRMRCSLHICTKTLSPTNVLSNMLLFLDHKLGFKLTKLHL